MAFCLEDGSALRDGGPNDPGEERTVIKPAAKTGGSRFVILVISGFMLLAFLLITLGIGGFIYYASGAKTAKTNSNVEETPAAVPTPESMDQYVPTPSPEPTVARTPDEPVKETPPKTPTPEPDEPDEPEAPPEPSRISGGVLNGKATSLPQPIYPPAARRAGISGRVVVQILVGKTGNVVSASASGGPRLLRPAAVRAARRAKFPPTYRSGQPVTVSGVLTYYFEP